MFCKSRRIQKLTTYFIDGSMRELLGDLGINQELVVVPLVRVRGVPALPERILQDLHEYNES